MTINIYLAHRNNTPFFEQQVTLIRKFWKSEQNIDIYGYVDGNNDSIKKQMEIEWHRLDVTPIDIPRQLQNQDRNHISPSKSFGLAFQYVYDNYILKTNNICICIENDIMPLRPFIIDTFIEGYEMAGEVRFNAVHLPDRMLMFWLGFIIFNNPIMTDRNMWRAESQPVVSRVSNKKYDIDCGGQSYYWITEKPRKIRYIKTKGDELYDPYTSNFCRPHNITTDIELLPETFQKGYLPKFRVLIYEDNLFIHLEEMGKHYVPEKVMWWKHCYSIIIND